MKNLLKLSIIALAACLLAGCAAIGTAVSHRNLEIQTLMSNTIFLSPEANQVPATVFVMMTNTTGHSKFSITNRVKRLLRGKGYTIVSDARRASFVLQVNILQVGRNSETAAKEMMGTGYGGALEGVVSGVAIAAATGGADLVAGGIVGGVATSVTDNLVQDVTYTVISDVRLIQHITPGKPIVNQTRVLSLANQVNLDFSSAEPQLERDLASSLAGLFINRN